MPTRSKSSKSTESAAASVAEIAILPDSVPVEMPELPLTLSITTLQQFRAISDPTRTKILGIIQNQPATAKQIAGRLKGTPGAIGHHLKVLEEVGLAQVVARRITRGIIAKYYTRTARMFNYDLASEDSNESVQLDIFRTAYHEFTEAVTERPDGRCMRVGFPRARLSEARMQKYSRRLQQLCEDFVAEPNEPAGTVYALSFALFEAPRYAQSNVSEVAELAKQSRRKHKAKRE